ncbi:PAS domain S-box protein [Paenibacillus terrae]|uniref:histidine kinase n=1 Tax=Paenibacillus terrae (strain HPL-003) TaxID=985665 RepID=G7VVZ7_PAETH|nr:PAS domain S-box protein [Paenibacillus terrae]AET58349.1 signal transduction histidine kinase [Paenibacillus terrae HPL-003]
MSIKIKITIILSGSVLFILLLNIALNYYTTHENLRSDSETKMVLTAKTIGGAIEQTQQSWVAIDKQLGYNLWLSATLAASKLDPDIDHITQEQLEQMTKRSGDIDISLIVRDGKGYKVAKSSNPKEIISDDPLTGYWKNAVDQLYEHGQAGFVHGQHLEHFWTGAFDYTGSDATDINKWGFYYDQKRNYMIRISFQDSEVQNFIPILNPDEIVKQTQQVDYRIMEITGINPTTFGGDTMDNQGNDRKYYYMYNKPIRFGTYQLARVQEDRLAVSKAIFSGESIVQDCYIKGQRVLVSYIPFYPANRDAYVIRIVMNYDTISSVIYKQLISLIAISIVLLEVVIIGSYVLASLFVRPIQSILGKVNEMADGHFDTRLQVKGGHELAQLGDRINAMAYNLGMYTRRLEQMYEENRSVKEHLESVINQTADAIHVTDQEERVIRVNHAFEALYGWTKKELVGRKLQFVPPQQEEEYEFQKERLLQGESMVSIESIRMRKDGSTVEISMSTSPILDEEGQILGFISVSRDITGRNRMEELLRRSEKLTTVGQLAAGVAHEIRNPLTTLRGFLQLQQQNKVLNLKHNDIMLSELDRINLIVSEFLILAKPQAVHFQKKDVRYIVSDVISLLDSQAHLLGIVFNLEVTEEPAFVYAEVNQLKQVFINLLKNSMEAMSRGGTITIHLFLEGESVKIFIRDQGTGIPAEMLSKLGEPFFTNKETGTGLGLMVSQRIIQSHKGTLDIESIEGEGTTALVQLPTAEPEQLDGQQKEA